jgi:hypothetical protein
MNPLGRLTSQSAAIPWDSHTAMQAASQQQPAWSLLLRSASASASPKSQAALTQWDHEGPGQPTFGGAGKLGLDRLVPRFK